MIFLYLVEMNFLLINFEVYVVFLLGDWVVNKNFIVLFCVFGLDYGFEYVNWLMKVNGGLVGIMFN